MTPILPPGARQLARKPAAYCANFASLRPLLLNG